MKTYPFDGREDVRFQRMHISALEAHGVETLEELRSLDPKVTRRWKNCGPLFRKTLIATQKRLEVRTMKDSTRRLAELLFTEMFDATGIMRAASTLDRETQARHVEHVERLAKVALLSADAFERVCDDFDAARGEVSQTRARAVREVGGYLDAGERE